MKIKYLLVRLFGAIFFAISEDNNWIVKRDVDDLAYG